MFALTTASAFITMKIVFLDECPKELFSKYSVPSNSIKGKEFKVEEETVGRSLAVDWSKSLSWPDISRHSETLELV